MIDKIKLMGDTQDDGWTGGNDDEIRLKICCTTARPYRAERCDNYPGLLPDHQHASQQISLGRLYVFRARQEKRPYISKECVVGYPVKIQITEVDGVGDNDFGSVRIAPQVYEAVGDGATLTFSGIPVVARGSFDVLMDHVFSAVKFLGLNEFCVTDAIPYVGKAANRLGGGVRLMGKSARLSQESVAKVQRVVDANTRLDTAIGNPLNRLRQAQELNVDPQPSSAQVVTDKMAEVWAQQCLSIPMDRREAEYQFTTKVFISEIDMNEFETDEYGLYARHRICAYSATTSRSWFRNIYSLQQCKNTVSASANCGEYFFWHEDLEDNEGKTRFGVTLRAPSSSRRCGCSLECRDPVIDFLYNIYKIY